MKLDSKIIVITGGANGIGRVSAQLFAGEGAQVIILDIDDEKGMQIEREIQHDGGYAKFIKVDISNYDNVISVFSDIEHTYKRIDVLYNNASVFLGQDDNIITEISLKTWMKIIGTNLHGLYFCTKSALPLMIKNGGSIINTASSAGLIGIPKCDAYTATKGATISLTRSLAVEYGPNKIRVNCIAPAAIYTSMIQESNLLNPDFNEHEFINKITPLRRWGQPEEIARIALFLASDDSSYINGAIIVADGGISIS